ncbi:MAG: hypothetical protein ACKVW3_04065 [Phycisphaerales bacterium]
MSDCSWPSERVPPPIHKDWEDSEWLYKQADALRQTRLFTEQGEGLGNYLTGLIHDVIEARDKYIESTKLLYTVLTIGGVAVAAVTHFAIDLHLLLRVFITLGLIAILPVANAFIDAVAKKLHGAYQIYSGTAIHAAVCHAAAGFPVTHNWFNWVCSSCKVKGIWFYRSGWSIVDKQIVPMPPATDDVSVTFKSKFTNAATRLQNHLHQLDETYGTQKLDQSYGTHQLDETYDIQWLSKHGDRLPVAVATFAAADRLEDALRQVLHLRPAQEASDLVRGVLSCEHHPVLGNTNNPREWKVQRCRPKTVTDVLLAWEAHPQTILIAYGKVFRRMRYFAWIGVGICAFITLIGKDPSANWQLVQRQFGAVQASPTCKVGDSW